MDLSQELKFNSQGEEMKGIRWKPYIQTTLSKLEKIKIAALIPDGQFGLIYNHSGTG
jgi:hypothetical protein